MQEHEGVAVLKWRPVLEPVRDSLIGGPAAAVAARTGATGGGGVLMHGGAAVASGHGVDRPHAALEIGALAADGPAAMGEGNEADGAGLVPAAPRADADSVGERGHRHVAGPAAKPAARPADIAGGERGRRRRAALAARRAAGAWGHGSDRHVAVPAPESVAGRGRRHLDLPAAPGAASMARVLRDYYGREGWPVRGGARRGGGRGGHAHNELLATAGRPACVLPFARVGVGRQGPARGAGGAGDVNCIPEPVLDCPHRPRGAGGAGHRKHSVRAGLLGAALWRSWRGGSRGGGRRAECGQGVGSPRGAGVVEGDEAHLGALALPTGAQLATPPTHRADEHARRDHQANSNGQEGPHPDGNLVDEPRAIAGRRAASVIAIAGTIVIATSQGEDADAPDIVTAQCL
mmetsp:Transcript_32041/g.82989  ORF Transcript_32041/g.82989 Transcript_32041/m.82989 type:complete len:405 (-) Transcript_32041:603-1817(-)